MARKLSDMTWLDVKKEMSIAGNPDKIVNLAEDVRVLVSNRIDMKNIAEIDNVEFALKVVIATLKQQRKIEYKRQHP